ncbi:MAG: hypothetical protein GWO02_01425 [Gammaproteobacteria bacterium]|nr:hypothetical protein [Gammaproteobacteria bacterium]
MSNAVGSIAVKTAFLAVADMAYRKAHLGHAAASAENLVMGAFLMTLLAIPLMAIGPPQIAVLGVHPASLVLIAAYVAGIRLVSLTHEMPM